MDNLSGWKESAQRFFVAFREAKERFMLHWRDNANERSVFLLVTGGAVALALYLYVITPPQAFPTGELVAVPEGLSVREIGDLLQSEGVIQSSFAFRLLVKGMRAEQVLHAGDYLFTEPKDLFSVARRIAIGAYGLEPIRFRIPEGATTREMAKLYGTRLQRFDQEEFLRKAQPIEGFLFPDTYFFLPNANEDVVIKAMQQNFETQIATIVGETATFGRPIEDIVIMASILEKEARNHEDRRMIAGVLWRRLDIGMALQVDAAFLYSLGRTTFDLTRADLQDKSDPYNTYANKGLPPGAIGSPSLSSLKAAVTPIDKGYLFYLADSSFITYYSKTYEEHLRLKAMYID